MNEAIELLKNTHKFKLCAWCDRMVWDTPAGRFEYPSNKLHNCTPDYVPE